MVKLEGSSNESVTLILPKFNKDIGLYETRTTDGNHTFYIKEYAPIRIKVSMLGEMKISLNRVTFNVQNTEIDNQNTN